MSKAEKLTYHSLLENKTQIFVCVREWGWGPGGGGEQNNRAGVKCNAFFSLFFSLVVGIEVEEFLEY